MLRDHQSGDQSKHGPQNYFVPHNISCMHSILGLASMCVLENSGVTGGYRAAVRSVSE
jgi:hypothetical protein